MSKKIRLIELFAGIGSQAMALRDLNIPFEHYRVVEFDKYAVASYNAIHGTHFGAYDIRALKGENLGIVDKENYKYIMTYSFPCQDLSNAGHQRGMKKDSGTRSGLLWEVERLLNETAELPQILLMENVPMVHAKKNMADFQLWIDFLASKGYVNKYQDVNAKDHGIPQNRNRCFMVSMLGDDSYFFPEKKKLTKTVLDFLEPKVAKKYYMGNKKAMALLINTVNKSNGQEKFVVDGTINQPQIRQISNCIKARYDDGISNLRQDGTAVVEKIPARLNKCDNGNSEHFQGLYDSSLDNIGNDVAGVITARYYKGIGANADNVVIEKESDIGDNKSQTSGK